jgi:hypothetical protein
MNINNLPEEIVKHEIMEYLKPKYKVVELTYLEISTHVSFDDDDDEPRLKTNTNVITRLFKINNPKNPYAEFREFIPYRCYMSQATMNCIEKIKKNENDEEQDKVFHRDREQFLHNTFVYISHSMVCS